MYQVNDLIRAVVWGSEEAVKEILSLHPEYLLIKGEAKDYAGRLIIATPFQAALGAEAPAMLALMIPYFKQLDLDDPYVEMRRQFDEQFPEGVSYRDRSDELKAIYDNYTKWVSEFSRFYHNGKQIDYQEMHQKLDDFRTKLTDKKIEKGFHFNIQHLILAYKAAQTAHYVELPRVVRWEGYEYWLHIIGFLQGLLPESYAEPHINRRAFRASAFKKKKEEKHKYDPLYFTMKAEYDAEYPIGFGYDFAYPPELYNEDEYGVIGPFEKVDRINDFLQHLSQLYKKKMAALIKLEKRLHSEPVFVSTCAIL